MRKLLGGATEDLREPANSFLMRYARDVVAVKVVRQAVFAGVCLVVDRLCRPNVPSPSHNREQKEKGEDDCYNNRCQDLSSRARKSRCSNYQTQIVIARIPRTAEIHAHTTFLAVARTLPGKGKQDALVLPWIALRSAWLAKQNCDAHRIGDFGAVALPERTAVLFTRSHDQLG